MSTASLITKTYPMTTEATYQGVKGKATTQVSFTFREDGWFNMTKAAKAFGKQLTNFWNQKDTQAYLEETIRWGGQTLKSNDCLFVAQRGGTNPGTWAHPKLAVFFARWLDVRFSVWCDAVIEDILKGNAELVIKKPEDSALVHLQEQMALLIANSNKLHEEVKALKDRPARPIGMPSAIQPPSLQAKPKDALMTIDAFFDEVKPEVLPYKRSRFAYTLARWCVDKQIAHCPASPMLQFSVVL